MTQILQRSSRESVECDLSEVPCGSFAFKKQWLIQDDTFYVVFWKSAQMPFAAFMFLLIMSRYNSVYVDFIFIFLCAVSVMQLFYIQQAVKLAGVSPEEN